MGTLGPVGARVGRGPDRGQAVRGHNKATAKGGHRPRRQNRVMSGGFAKATCVILATLRGAPYLIVDCSAAHGPTVWRNLSAGQKHGELIFLIAFCPVLQFCVRPCGASITPKPQLFTLVHRTVSF